MRHARAYLANRIVHRAGCVHVIDAQLIAHGFNKYRCTGNVCHRGYAGTALRGTVAVNPAVDQICSQRIHHIITADSGAGDHQRITSPTHHFTQGLTGFYNGVHVGVADRGADRVGKKIFVKAKAVA